MSKNEIVTFEVYVKNNVAFSESRYFSTVVVIEDINDWHLAATRWITNLCATLSDTDFFPVGNVRCRRADYAVFLKEESKLVNSDYQYFGVILEGEWAVDD